MSPFYPGSSPPLLSTPPRLIASGVASLTALLLLTMAAALIWRLKHKRELASLSRFPNLRAKSVSNLFDFQKYVE